MKFSLQDIHESAEFAQSHLWTVSFPGQQSLNVFNMGGSVGEVFSATDVIEPIVEFQTEEVQLAGGLRLVMPLHSNYYGDLVITMREKSKQELRKELLTWVNDAQPSTFQFQDIQQIAKRCQVDKYSRESSGPILTSVYWVLPPEKLSFTGTSDLGHSTDALTFKVVGCERKFE